MGFIARSLHLPAALALRADSTSSVLRFNSLVCSFSPTANHASKLTRRLGPGVASSFGCSLGAGRSDLSSFARSTSCRSFSPYSSASGGFLVPSNTCRVMADVASSASRAASTQNPAADAANPAAKRGAFIVLEGLDRSGKSTQAARLLTHLESRGLGPVMGMRFPDRSTPIGREIDAYLRETKEIEDRRIHELFAANRFEKKQEIEDHLAQGTSLIVDRYSFSGVAYSAAMGLDVQWCESTEVGLPAPDIVIYLDINPQHAAERGEYGGERYEKVEFQQRVGEHFLALRDDSWKVVDASLPLEDVSLQVCKFAESVLNKCKAGELPLRHLWE